MPNVTGAIEGSLWDYFGIPIDIQNLPINALPSRAYNLIYNDWFRDENLIDSLTVDRDDGPDTFTDYTLQRRGKRHDYFTSCLPWPIKDPDNVISLPLGSEALIKYDNNFSAGGNAAEDNYVDLHRTTIHTNLYYGATPGVGTALVPDGSEQNIYADLSTATAATINDLREAFQL